MKRFEFSLTHVLGLRRSQLELEELALEALLAERRAIASEIALLEQESLDARRLAASAVTAAAEDLAVLDRYLAHAARRRERLLVQAADCEQRIQRRQQAVREARRKVRLLERLQHKQRGAWQQAADRELEALAQELYLCRWRR